MEVIDIEGPTAAANTAKPKSSGVTIKLKVKRKKSRVVLKGYNGSIYLRTGPQQQPDVVGIKDVLYETLEVLQLLMILFIFIILLKIADMGY